MAFRLITGTMGGGKSYYGAELAARGWGEGAIVHSNLAFIDEELDKRGWLKKFVRLSDEPSTWEERMIGGAEGAENVVIIDESMVIFDAMDYQANRRKYKDLNTFLTQTRKLGLDIFFIAQAQSGLDKQYSKIALEVINCTAVKEWPVVGPFMVTLRGDFCRVRKSPNGVRRGPPTYHRLDKEGIGSIYKTEALASKYADIPRVVGRKPRNETGDRRRAWAMLGGFLATMLGLMWIIKISWGKLFGGSPPVEKTEAAAKPAPQPPARVSEPAGVGGTAFPTRHPEPPPARRFKVWGVADWGRLCFWEAVTGIQVQLGSVYDDGLVTRLEMDGRIFRVALDDGRNVIFRPATRQDAPQEKEQQPVKPSWKSLSSPLSNHVSGLASESLTSGSQRGNQSTN